MTVIRFVIVVAFFGLLPPYLLRYLIQHPRTTRKRFAIIVSGSFAIFFLFVSLVFIDSESFEAIIIGIVLLLLNLLVGYPVFYSIYPRIRRSIDQLSKTDRMQN